MAFNNLNSSGNQSMKNFRNGYDLPLLGLGSGFFDQLHITVLSCIALSSTSAIAVLYMSFKRGQHNNVGFFQWREINRFVVYMAICDLSFNIMHSMDHLHVFITREHAKPKELCQLYAFMLIEFIGGQVLMVNLVAVNMFLLIYFNKKIGLGRCDWKLLSWMFGYPFVVNIVALCTDTLGPNSSL